LSEQFSFSFVTSSDFWVGLSSEPATMDAADNKPAVVTNGAHEGVVKQLRAHDIPPAEFAEKRYDPETLEIDHVAEKKLVRKLDLFIIPPVMLLYLFVSRGAF
jgi:hypothetical protein